MFYPEFWKYLGKIISSHDLAGEVEKDKSTLDSQIADKTKRPPDESSPNSMPR